MNFKKLSVLGVFLLVVTLFFNACSNKQSASGSEKKEKEPTTKIFKSVKGDVEIPTDPKRIVAGWYLGDMVSLGITPVGAGTWELGSPYVPEETKKEVVNIGEPISVEKVLELKPDLIVVGNDENYEQLSKIAPTVVVPYASSKNIYEEIRTIGEIISKEDEAEKWIKEFDASAAKAREKIKGIVREDETVGIYEITEDEVWVFGDNWGRGGQTIYNALQLKAPESLHDVVGGSQYKQLSLETLPDYAADYMFITDYTTVQDNAKPSTIVSNNVWKNLDAVKNDHAYVMPYMEMYFSDPLALENQLNLVVEKILTAK